MRPSFGVLSPEQQAIVELQVKFSGSPEELPKGKILINWIRAAQDVTDHRLSHNEFSQRYKESKGDGSGEKEGSLMLQLQEQQAAQQSRQQEIQYAPTQGEDYVRNSSINSQEESTQLQTSPEKSQFDSPPKEQEGKVAGIALGEPKTVTVEKRSGFSLPIVLLMVLVAFLIGVSLGMKIEKMMSGGEEKQKIEAASAVPETATESASDSEGSQPEAGEGGEKSADAPGNGSASSDL